MKYVPSQSACYTSIGPLVRIYPNGENETSRGKVSIFLQLSFKKEMKIRAIGTFTFHSGVWSETFYGLYENSNGCGLELCSTEDLFDVKKGFIANRELAISFEGHLFAEKKDCEIKLLDNEMDDECLASKNQEKNFKIIVGENEIDVNKDLLADVSTVWNGMLQSGMKESIEGKMEITDFPFKIADAAVKLIYGISPTFTLDDMLPLLVFADKYDIQLIKELVETHLIFVLAPSNVCQLVYFSTLFNAPKLFKKSAEYFVQCAKDKIALSDYDLIDKEMTYKIFCSTFPPVSY